MSLTQVKNNERPSIDPCGTPHDMLEVSEKEFFKFILNLKFDR